MATFSGHMPILALFFALYVPWCTVHGEVRTRVFSLTGGKDSYLTNLVMGTHTTRDQLECAHLCVRDSKCQSFNFINRDKQTSVNCELNMDSRDGSGMSLAARVDWTYWQPIDIEADDPGVGVTAAAYDSTRKWMYLAYQGHLFVFPELGQTGDPSLPSTQFNMGGHDVQAMVVVNNTDGGNVVHFRWYLGGGGVMNTTLDIPQLKLTMGEPFTTTITDLHGPSMSNITTVDGAANFNGTLYIFANETTFELNDDGQIENVYPSYVYSENNKFPGMPLHITGATEITFPQLFFFKGVRYYNYDVVQRRVVAAGLLINS